MGNVRWLSRDTLTLCVVVVSLRVGNFYTQPVWTKHWRSGACLMESVPAWIMAEDVLLTWYKEGPGACSVISPERLEFCWRGLGIIRYLHMKTNRKSEAMYNLERTPQNAFYLLVDLSPMYDWSFNFSYLSTIEVTLVDPSLWVVVFLPRDLTEKQPLGQPKLAEQFMLSLNTLCHLTL